jgi:ORF6N domain-containing protein
MGLATKVFNQAVRRNSRRFPEDFAFQLTTAEVANLRSQAVTSNQKNIEDHEDTDNWLQIGTSSRGGREHGALMAANILRSERAVHMSAFVIRAFVRLREHIAANQLF